MSKLSSLMEAAKQNKKKTAIIAVVVVLVLAALFMRFKGGSKGGSGGGPGGPGGMQDTQMDNVARRLEAAGGQLMDWNFELRGAQSWICDEDRWDYRDIQVQMPDKEYTFHV